MDELHFMTKAEIDALREEAEQIEKGLEEDPFIDSMDPPKELYRRLIQELKDKGIYEDDSFDCQKKRSRLRRPHLLILITILALFLILLYVFK